VTDDELALLRATCARQVTHHKPSSPRRALTELAAYVPSELAFDRYGSGGWLAEFEDRVASELGKEAAVFLPSGTLAQQIALRIWCDRRHNPTIAFHPTCHLEIHESRGYAMLHGLRALLVGAPSRLMTVEDVRAIADPLGAFVVELPQREIGAQLPAWDDLVALCAAARVTGAKLHLDGARLWEAAAFYERPHAEIAALFDSVYVSFYKGLGAMAGAMLAGDADFVAQARLWQHRHGGRLVTIAPLALSAERGFATNLSKMPAYRESALAVAERLLRIEGVSVVPNPPQTNTFHVFLRGGKDDLEREALAYARDHWTFIFGRLAPTVDPGVQKWEFVAGDATLECDLDEIERAVRQIVKGAAISARSQVLPVAVAVPDRPNGRPSANGRRAADPAESEPAETLPQDRKPASFLARVLRAAALLRRG
jgi:threonine aldolase